MTFQEIIELTQRSRKKLVERKVKKYSKKINDYINYMAKHGEVRADFYLTYENSQVSYDAVQKLKKDFSEQGYDIEIKWIRDYGNIDNGGYFVRVSWSHY